MPKARDNSNGEKPRSYPTEGVEVIQRNVKMKPELYRLACAEAEAEGITLSEVFTRAFAERCGHPELWTVEKLRPGPRPGKPKETAKAS